MNERQLTYLETLRATGNPSRARQAAGVTRRQVSNWERDERFAEEAEEAEAHARDELLQKAREMAMAGDASVMNTWMRALIPSLRPPATNVALGVQVGGRAAVDRSPEALEALGAKLERAIEAAEMRGQSLAEYLTGKPADIVDAEDARVLPPPPVDPESLL